MSESVQELRPKAAPEVVGFAKSCGCDVTTGRLVPALSLVAVDEAGDATAAVALSFEQSDRRHRLEVGVKDPSEQAALHRTLVDKALMKLAAAGVRKFDIKTNGQPESNEFWQAVSWIDRTLGGSDDEQGEAA